MFSRKFLLLYCAVAPGFTSFVARAATSDFPDSVLLLKPNISVPNYELSFRSLADGREVVWAPNVRELVGIDFYIKGLFGAGLAVRGPQQEGADLKGETKYQDWRLSLAFDSFLLQLDFQQYRGFYAQNAAQVDPSYVAGGDFLQAPEMKARNIAVGFSWVFSPERFSLPAAIDNTVRQTASGGSWLAGFSLGENLFSNPTGLIPDAVEASFGADRDIREGRFLNIVPTGGYGYTWVFGSSGKWFLTGILNVGVGTQRRNLRGEGVDEEGWREVIKADLFFGLGYSGDVWVGGLAGTAAGTTIKTRRTEISSMPYSSVLYFGRRF
jgi:hypothetical protein